MEKWEQWFRDTFYPWQAVWKFSKAYGHWVIRDNAIDNDSPERPTAEVLHELVERIYRQGWEDALTAAKQALSEVRA